MKRKNQKTLALIFSRPVSGNVKWKDIEQLFVELGAEIVEGEGSRVGVRLFAIVVYFTDLIHHRILIKARFVV
jgi:hypothetical protein